MRLFLHDQERFVRERNFTPGCIRSDPRTIETGRTRHHRADFLRAVAGAGLRGAWGSRVPSAVSIQELR